MDSKSKQIKVEIQSRTGLGSGECGRLRRLGRVPGNVYGMDLPSYAISIEAHSFYQKMKTGGGGQNTIVNLVTEDGAETRDVLIKEMQRDPVTSHLVHIDFFRVDPTKPVNVTVPVRLVGLADGVKNQNGILDFVRREIPITCLMADIPSFFELDVTELSLNDNLSVSDLDVSDNVTVNEDPGSIIVVISATKIEEEEVAVDEDAEEGAEAEEGTDEKAEDGSAPADDKKE
jgi:large subunit ribosomal protein L25